MAAALARTAFLVRTLARLATAPTSRPPPRSAQALAGFAAASFAVLAYHMLAFLGTQYRAWAGTGASLSWTDLDAARVWRWLTETGLFERFANDLCADDAVVWWTGNALLHALLVSVYIAVEGKSLSWHGNSF